MPWNNAKKRAFRFALCLLPLLIACSAHHSPDWKLEGNGFRIKKTGEVVDPRIDEISGIAESRRKAGQFWVINDSGNEAMLHLIDQQGRVLHTVVVKDAVNLDWEDVAAFEENGKPRLLIADTGANAVERQFLTIYVLEEPTEKADTVKVERRIDFVFAEGVLDCEAAAVDVGGQKILLITKRTNPPICYELPLHLSSSGPLTLERAAEITTIRQPMPDEIKRPLDRHQAQVTAMDLSYDGSQLTLLTYRRLYLYALRPDRPWYLSMADDPLVIEFPAMQQAEAVCFTSRTGTLLITTEKLPAPILEISLDETPRID